MTLDCGSHSPFTSCLLYPALWWSLNTSWWWGFGLWEPPVWGHWVSEVVGNCWKGDPFGSPFCIEGWLEQWGNLLLEAQMRNKCKQLESGLLQLVVTSYSQWSLCLGVWVCSCYITWKEQTGRLPRALTTDVLRQSWTKCPFADSHHTKEKFMS